MAARVACVAPLSTSNYARSVWHDCGQFPRTYLCLLLFAWGFVSYLSSAPWAEHTVFPHLLDSTFFRSCRSCRSFVYTIWCMEKVCMDVIMWCLVIFIRQPSLGTHTSRSNGLPAIINPQFLFDTSGTRTGLLDGNRIFLHTIDAIDTILHTTFTVFIFYFYLI